MFNWNDVGGNITPMQVLSGNAPVIVNNDYSELKKKCMALEVILVK